MKWILFISAICLGNGTEQTNMDLANSPTFNRFQSWQQMGTTTVKFSATKDIIYPKYNKQFTKIKFVVGGSPVSLEDATVIYIDGSNEIIHVLSIIPRSGESRELELKNDSTDIRQVNITYKAAKGFSDQNAKISIWGMPKSY